MNIETLREYCLLKKGVSEEFPFGEDTLVFKVSGKMFLLTSLQNPVSFNAKCDPEKAIELRERYSEVQPGYHMNKKHWNTAYMNGAVPENELLEWIDHSYQLVISSLSKKLRDEIGI